MGNYRQECTAIKLAAQEGFDAIVKGLIRVAGASLHHLNDQRCTALHLAAKNGHIARMVILVSSAFCSELEPTRMLRRLMTRAYSRFTPQQE